MEDKNTGDAVDRMIDLANDARIAGKLTAAEAMAEVFGEPRKGFPAMYDECARCLRMYAAFRSECPYCLMRPIESSVN